MARKKRNINRNLRPKVKRDCPFCKGVLKVHWTNYEKFGDFLSVRGRILAKAYTGLCAKHQRRLAEAVKHARHLALLPFVTSL